MVLIVRGLVVLAFIICALGVAAAFEADDFALDVLSLNLIFGLGVFVTLLDDDTGAAAAAADVVGDNDDDDDDGGWAEDFLFNLSENF